MVYKVFIRFTRKEKVHYPTYKISDCSLECVREFKYLGVYFTSTLCWHRHIDYITRKASRTLGFLRRNTSTFPQTAREILYKTNIRPILEYACTVWDPPTLLDTAKLEKLQSLATRYVLGKLAKETSFSKNTRLNLLNWESLEHCRTVFRLKLFYDVYFSQNGMPRESYIFPPHHISARIDHVYKVREIDCKCSAFFHSFFPKTIRQWNRLPSSVFVHHSSNTFLSTVTSLEGLN